MNKVFLAVAASGVVFLSGCASSTDSATTAKMDELSNQVSQLSDQVASLKSSQMMLSDKIDQTSDSVNAVREEAQRANERIDHIAQSYTK
ncbi:MULTISPECIES: Lpp/OprI family alanine-zipper lipoprotein [Vibrio]|jgi:murein lipoprotein|uniref:Major outer membrane lipoprotein Lpp n=2 Tax=Vibrio TaxID=662 RepID=A0A1R4LQZ5_VIBR1|nr:MULTISPECIES: Lpp/OprI family alanine-zipper lipoprotein [Vibrio]USP16031.1 Lpp/OprI family alanine-zipper lipoprotein [Vibrio gazogenes]WNJ97165.1 Lpp/OprI family alanine-zipper lipoprotein [Vibrio ruber]SHE39902.1 murein lipoprotein [Vibrio gazogenes DSM 21264] [Vibrio gazogenes DSM 21264 = NBRC 103151]SJN58809.1 Major outer membrane lipoprotein Lpp precursor [Vibrio ruber DSM 16370]SJN59347.1 Major outer membrane lipoprotein Lpp precursor [Vibrio gazogenes]